MKNIDGWDSLCYGTWLMRSDISLNYMETQLTVASDMHLKFIYIYTHTEKNNVAVYWKWKMVLDLFFKWINVIWFSTHEPSKKQNKTLNTE